MKPAGFPIATAPSAEGVTEVTGLTYDLNRLRITVEDEAGNEITVEFSDSIGFRVLNECDLLDFWPTFSTAAGSAFEISSGGWHDLESKRVGGCLVFETQPDAREFLITGCDDCVSVIASSEPTIVTEQG